MMVAWKNGEASTPTAAQTGGLRRGPHKAKKGKTKYAPSARRSGKGITVSEKKYARLTGTLGTQYPGLKKGEIRTIRDAKHRYTVESDGYGGMAILDKTKI